jgi:hypothetical protein
MRRAMRVGLYLRQLFTRENDAASGGDPGSFSMLVKPKVALALLGLSVGLGACNIGDGFADLGDVLLPDAALLDRPGRRLRAGSYSDLTVDGSLDDGGRVLALRHDEGDIGLAVVPFLEGDPCDLYPAVGFERVSSRVSLDLGAIVAVQTTADSSGRGTIRFVDFNCEDVLPSVGDATLPRVVFPESSPRGLLVFTGTGTLELIDVEKKSLVPISKNVEVARVAGDTLWTLEGGALIGRDDDLDELVSLGSEVTEFVADVGESDVVFVEGGQLFAWTEGQKEDGGLRVIAEDACNVRALSPKVLSFLSPCASARFTMEVAGEAVGRDEPHLLVLGPEGVLSRFTPDARFGFTDEASYFQAIRNADPAALSGELVAAILPPKPELNSEGAIELEFTVVADNVSLVQGQWLQNWDGSVGDLMEATENEGELPELNVIKRGVTLLPGIDPFDRPGLLVDFDGVTGTLTELTRSKGKISSKTLTPSVPLQGITSEADSEYVAYVGKFDPELGVGVPYLLANESPIALGKEAFVGTLRFLDQPRAVAYLGPTDGPSGAALRAYLLESGIDLLVADGVNEYRGLPWPSPGILYSVWEGENAGLWLAKAR